MLQNNKLKIIIFCVYIYMAISLLFILKGTLASENEVAVFGYILDIDPSNTILKNIMTK